MINVESPQELDAVGRVAARIGVRAPISLRVNPDVDPKTHPYISTGLKETKFGVAWDDALPLYRRARSMRGIAVRGIDTHIGSQITEIEPYREASRKILDLPGLAAAPALAQPNSASTQLLNAPVSGSTLSVRFTVFGTTPVVPYEYALKNVCAYPKGHFTLGQQDDIVYWTDQDPNGNPMVTMPVYLQSVPSGASCRVSLMRNNTVVKGSTVNYTVS